MFLFKFSQLGLQFKYKNFIVLSIFEAGKLEIVIRFFKCVVYYFILPLVSNIFGEWLWHLDVFVKIFSVVIMLFFMMWCSFVHQVHTTLHSLLQTPGLLFGTITHL